MARARGDNRTAATREGGQTDAAPGRRRGPKPITLTSLENAALYYLKRFASSSANLKRVLMHKVMRAASLRRQGNSRFAIRGKLALKGVEGALIDDTLAELDEDGTLGEIAAACALVRRRRLGPFRSAASSAMSGTSPMSSSSPPASS